MIMSCDKKTKQIGFKYNSIIISSLYPVTLLGIGIDNKLNSEKLVLTVTSFYIFLSKLYNLLYIYIFVY